MKLRRATAAAEAASSGAAFSFFSGEAHCVIGDEITRERSHLSSAVIMAPPRLRLSEPEEVSRAVSEYVDALRRTLVNESPSVLAVEDDDDVVLVDVDPVYTSDAPHHEKPRQAHTHRHERTQGAVTDTSATERGKKKPSLAAESSRRMMMPPPGSREPVVPPPLQGPSREPSSSSSAATASTFVTLDARATSSAGA